MRRQDESFFGSDEDLVEPFRINAGFIAFVAVACLPAFVALVIFFGAWIVADDVKQAEANTAPGEAAPVEGWKTTLVGLCPVH